MITLSIIVFFLALIGIIALFVQKHREISSGKVMMPSTKEKLDRRAREIKELMVAAETDLQKIPSGMVSIGREVVRIGALGAARAARVFEVQSHKLADIVSHKHRFERRAPRSEFLTKISERKSGGEGNEANVASPELDVREE